MFITASRRNFSANAYRDRSLVFCANRRVVITTGFAYAVLVSLTVFCAGGTPDIVGVSFLVHYPPLVVC